MLDEVCPEVRRRFVGRAPALMLAAFFQVRKQQVSLPHQADAHRISRHALSLFNCGWFEEY